jgi:hypothetical protein
VHNFELSKFKSCEFTSLKNMTLEDAPPVHVHNAKTVKRKHCG